MSKIGKQAIEVPSEAKIEVAGDVLKIQGPLEKFERKIPAYLKVTLEDNQLLVELDESKTTDESRAMWGTFRALVANEIEGATKGFTKQLDIEGVGYNAKAQGDTLVLSMGFSHPVEMKVPAGIKAEVNKNSIILTSPHKEALGQFAANVRDVKPPEPYKGKGIRYVDEYVRRKEGKKAAGEGEGGGE